MIAPQDQAQRDAIVHERERNVVVIAGAGTGKTSTILDRAVELLAPSRPSATPLSIQRMAAITFTRRAAGELRFRLRERLLRELETDAAGGSERGLRLREALGSLDAAFIGTIHGFADRLLRLRPVEADLSPSYALVEDESDLVRETLQRLRRAAETDSMARELGRFTARVGDPQLIAEAADTLRIALRSGLQAERVEGGFGAPASLETMLQQMIATRDVPVIPGELPVPGLSQAKEAVSQLRAAIEPLRGGSRGARYLRRVSSALRRLESTDDPAEAVRLVNDCLRGLRPFPRDFGSDNLALAVFRTIDPDGFDPWRLVQMKGPHRWLATRLVRLAPVACAMYERVKTEHEVVDYLDLLIKLRDLLRDKPEARRFYQGLLDHIFVDEFQDTDPLQCEIVFYLCGQPPERSAASAPSAWARIPLVPGKLTIVGDPKQSIYRFRRADIAVYGAAVERLAEGGALQCRLDTNFRSQVGLVDFYNLQLARVLGRDPDAPFDPEAGCARYEDMHATPGDGAGDEPCVHVLPYSADDDSGLLAREGRMVEAAMLARYIRWLVQQSYPVRDPVTGEKRPLRLGDIAILACVTTNLPLLLRELDAFDLGYAARGGTLFFGHPVVRQFLLALRALADVDDGIAQSALLRPPFFAVDWADAVTSLVVKDPADERRARMQQAREIVTSLRRNRFRRSPGATARDLIERTGLGRSVACGRNGAQCLAALYEVAAELERHASLSRLDFDAATERFRAWASRPVFLDAAEPIGEDAVRVMTVHGAKGLEFPITILWDGFQRFADPFGDVWSVDRSGESWALSLGAVAVEHPPGNRLLARERAFGEQESRRKYYVAATRARDLLVVPLPATKGTYAYAHKSLLEQVPPAAVRYLETFRRNSPPAWARPAPGTTADEIAADAELEAELEQGRVARAAAIERSSSPLAVPAAATGEVRGAVPEEEEEAGSELAHKARGGRLGPIFGTAVHLALDLYLSGNAVEVDAAVAAAAVAAGLRENQEEARGDVRRGLAALLELGITAKLPSVRTEYPLAALREGCRLVSGYIDLLAIEPQRLTVIDFKTDPPPPGKIEWSYRVYAQQLRLYVDLLRAAGVVGDRAVRCGLLFTADGSVHWLND